MIIQYNGKAFKVIVKEYLDDINKSRTSRHFEKNQAKLNVFGVRQCSLFGSFLYDQATAESDIDLLIEFEPGKKTFTNFSNLVFFLEELLGRRVEVVTIESLSPYIGPHILREAEHVTIGA